MRYDKLSENVLSSSAIFLLSVSAGLINGILGAGSGILFLLIPKLLAKTNGKDVYSFAMTCVIPVSLVSLLSYPPSLFTIETVLPLLIPGIVGGIFGAFLQEKIHLSLLNTVFALITIYSGISMLTK